mmetsp:Transcript_106198/g.342589  ORF Transcript_106198/g.342589 Transcript_106198/m.342589 type:complete len:298 (-) Transcript_106198:192-1085(-)
MHRAATAALCGGTLNASTASSSARRARTSSLPSCACSEVSFAKRETFCARAGPWSTAHAPCSMKRTRSSCTGQRQSWACRAFPRPSPVASRQWKAAGTASSPLCSARSLEGHVASAGLQGGLGRPARRPAACMRFEPWEQEFRQHLRRRRLAVVCRARGQREASTSASEAAAGVKSTGPRTSVLWAEDELHVPQARCWLSCRRLGRADEKHSGGGRQSQWWTDFELGTETKRDGKPHEDAMTERQHYSAGSSAYLLGLACLAPFQLRSPCQAKQGWKAVPGAALVVTATCTPFPVSP